MRTLALLAALLLLALQARAQVLQQTADQVPAQDQDQPEAQDQDQPDAEDKDVVVSFTGEERLTRQALGLRKQTTCTCRPNLFCKSHESAFGYCRRFGRRYKRCCRVPS